MHSKIILKSFEKAKVKLNDSSGTEPSFNSCSKYLSEKIYETNGFSFGDRSLRELHNKSVVDSKIKVEIKQPKVVEALCMFLDYKGYADFVIKNRKLNEEPIIHPIKVRISRNKKILSGIIIIITTTVIAIYLSIDKTKWMIWQDGHYIEVSFDTEKYSLNQLKLYKEERIKNFKKINPTCEYVFYNKDESVNIWYGKNAKKELEFFTDLGLHPETGKTLKPITHYMIDKYICIND